MNIRGSLAFIKLAVVIALVAPIGTSAANDGTIVIAGQSYPSLQAAFAIAKDGDTIEIGTGDYAEAVVLRASNVTIIAIGKVLIHGQAAQSKAALVIKGNNTTIRGIECFDIVVRDGNGACVRLEGQNLNLDNVYFHDSQEGLLTGQNPGIVVIENSRFERLGYGGQAHGIYIGRNGILLVRNSQFLSSKGEGHAIKSRARVSIIIDNVIASLEGIDSRLIDVPNGGDVMVVRNILQNGPNSSNGDLIGFGLEGKLHDKNVLTVVGNVVLLEREGPDHFIHARGLDENADVRLNIIVGRERDEYALGNFPFKTRADAGLPAYPELPPMKQERVLPE